MASTSPAPASVQSSVATEVSLKPPSSAAQTPPPAPQAANGAGQEHARVPRIPSTAAVNTALDGPGPPLLQSDSMHPRDARARRRLDVASSPGQGRNLSGASPAQSMFSPSVRGSEQGIQGRLSRITARALARGSMRDSGSESSKMAKDVYRDDRGRRVERPKVVKSDVHVIGELVGASGFPRRQAALSCRYRLVYDGVRSWTVVRGLEAGCTQVSSSADCDDDFVAWEHPIDLHLTTQKLESWPSLLLMVYGRDDSANKDCFLAYALCPLPNTPGMHQLTVRTWYPVETRKLNVRNIFAHYLGMAPRLDDDLTDLGFATDVRMRQEAGPHIASVGTGCVHVRLQMLFRHLGGLARQMGDHLYKSLENFQTQLEEGRKKEAHRKAALAEHQANQKHGGISAGLKQLQDGRAERFDRAQRAVEHRQRSMTPSHDGSQSKEWPRSEAGMRANGVQSAPRVRLDTTMASTTTPDFPSPAAAPFRSPGAAGRQAREAGPEQGGIRRDYGSTGALSSGDEVLSRRQAERDRRRQGMA